MEVLQETRITGRRRRRRNQARTNGRVGFTAATEQSDVLYDWGEETIMKLNMYEIRDQQATKLMTL